MTMFETPSPFHRHDGNHHRAVGTLARHPSESILSAFRHMQFRPRVLIVEFRDEVYAALKAVLEEYDCHVERAAFGAGVAGQLIRFSPDLVLINESMPDESGWLIACKIRFMRRQHLVWLYAVRRPQPSAAWEEVSGVRRVIGYGGVLVRLVQHVRRHVAQWMGRLDGDPEHNKLSIAPSAFAKP